MSPEELLVRLDWAPDLSATPRLEWAPDPSDPEAAETARLVEVEQLSPSRRERKQATRKLKRMGHADRFRETFKALLKGIAADPGLRVTRSNSGAKPVRVEHPPLPSARNSRTPRRAARTARSRATPALSGEDGPPEPPRLRAPCVAAAPVLVSDATAEVVCGLTGRQFRKFAHEHGLLTVKVGRRTLARTDALLALFDRLTGADSPPAEWDEDAVVAAAARGAK